MKPVRNVYLRTWRGPGAPGGWHVTARVCNRHGHIKAQYDARTLLRLFKSGWSVTELARLNGERVDVVEDIIRQMLAREHLTGLRKVRGTAVANLSRECKRVARAGGVR
jgi:hypothetical protein